MTDVFDRASEQEELDREVAMRAHQNRAGLAGKTVSDSATECQDCDEPIPYARRAAVPGCSLCVECQTVREKALHER